MNIEFDILKNRESAICALCNLPPWELKNIELEYVNSFMSYLAKDFHGSYEEYIDIHDSMLENQDISKEDIYYEYQRSKSQNINPEFVDLVEFLVFSWAYINPIAI